MQRPVLNIMALLECVRLIPHQKILDCDEKEVGDWCLAPMRLEILKD